MVKKQFKITVEQIMTTLTWIVILGGWYTITKFEIVSKTLVPSPSKVFTSFINILKDGYSGDSIWIHLWASFQRLFTALGLAIVTAVPLGLLSGYYKKVRAIIDSVVEFYRPLPPLAYYTLLVLWLGIDNTSKVTMLYLAGFAPMYIACVSAVTKINQDYILSAKTLGATQNQVFFKIVLPACLPEIFVGLRTAVGVEYTTLVAAEMVAATSGIGWLVLDASKFLKADIMFVGILIMGITGILIDVVLRLIENKMVFWKGHV
ncbi:ABC transporter permease [uncultured Ilyobacter sp.]|uniref:ABC transporter permease n=1 Tax=uncultured Ilyobacter sp. TaxID=544433 RepID=UPI002AA74AF6|nr:ABC transporter permease [uncultured Ilyobacter sp.]